MKLLRWLLFIALNIGALYLIDFALTKLILFLMGWIISSTFAWIVFILCISIFVLPIVYFILSLIISPLYYLCPKKRIGIIVIKGLAWLDSILTIILIWAVTIGGYELSDNYKIVVTVAFIIKTIMILKIASKVHTDFKLNNESEEYRAYKGEL